MRHLIVALAVAGLGLMFAADAQAGCGIKNATTGTLEKYDAATKSITIAVKNSSDPKEVAAKTAKLTMTPTTKVILKKGLKIDSLVGKEVTVVSEHGKIDFVIPLAAS
jgi:hypothetical protein